MKPLTILLAAAFALSCSSKEPYVQPEADEPLVPSNETTGPSDAEPNAAAPEPVAVDLATVDPASLVATAPDQFNVRFETTEGDFEMEVVRAWAPKGVDRFYNLVNAGYYRDIATFRVIDGFMAQFGIHGDPAVNENWKEAEITDDVQVTGVSNTRGMMSFATAGPDTRTVQLFINFADNSRLDGMGFHPIGRVVGDGMSVVDSWHSGYGEGAPRGRGPDQNRLQAEGNDYLRDGFPELSYITSISVVR